MNKRRRKKLDKKIEAYFEHYKEWVIDSVFQDMPFIRLLEELVAAKEKENDRNQTS